MADVAIIGAGLAGLVLARALIDFGLKVVVLESGSEHQIEDIHPFNEVEMGDDLYRGAAEGRFRALGGTSTRWGAALLPFLNGDSACHPRGWHNGWGFDANELTNFLAPLEQDFGVNGGSYEGEDALTDFLPSFQPRLPKWPAFKNRATSNIYHDRIRRNPQLHVWIDATVTDIQLDVNRVSGVEALNANGNKLKVSASQVVVAAGAIETTRLLLLLNRAQEGRVFQPISPLGQGFHDHLSAPIANLKSIDRAALVRLFSFHFVPGGMRNLRFELTADARALSDWPAAFLHIAFTRGEENGFEGMRRVYQAMQRRTIPSLSDFGIILSDLPWFIRAGWWRFIERRLLPPSSANFEIHLITEQKPDLRNCISLSTKKHDSFGLALAKINWRIADEDKQLFLQIAKQTLSEWRAGPLAALAEPVPRDAETMVREIVNGGGIYHPAGTTRIGPDASQGVVDSRLRVHGVPGLWAVATSVFPSVGGTSPSLGLMQLALRAAQDIATSVGGKT